jgi:uncharacterized RDD family membrane protein YckC
MKTMTVITPANIEVEYRLAGAGSRLAAFTVDFLLQTVFILLVSAVALFLSGWFEGMDFDSLGGYVLAFIIIIAFAVYAGYFIVCELTMNGQSPGKKIFGLRAIRDNGQPIGLSQSLVRNVFRIALDMLYVGLFSIMFSKKHKRFGDMAAGTVVVSEHYETPGEPTFKQVFNAQAPDAISPEYAFIKLTEEERVVLLSYKRRKNSLPMRGEAQYRQITEYLAMKWRIDARFFDEDVLDKLADIKD